MNWKTNVQRSSVVVKIGEAVAASHRWCCHLKLRFMFIKGQGMREGGWVCETWPNVDPVGCLIKELRLRLWFARK